MPPRVPDERTLAFLRELERADGEAATALAELDDLAARVERLRVRAPELARLAAELPVEQGRLRGALADARQRSDAARQDLRAAEAALEAAPGDGRREAAARHAVTRAGDTLRMAERKEEELSRELAQCQRDAEATARESGELNETAASLAAELCGRPRLAEQAGAAPSAGLEGVGDWASAARAALFVARGTLAREREGLIRQANELGTILLGEPILASAASDVARRVERIS